MCGIDEKNEKDREEKKKKTIIIIILISNNVPRLKLTGESSNELGVQAFQFLALKERKKNLYIIQVSLLLMPRKILQIKIQFMKITLKKYTEGCQQTNKMIYWNNGTHRRELKMEK